MLDLPAKQIFSCHLDGVRGPQFRLASDSLMFRTAEAALCGCFAVVESIRKDLSRLSLSQQLLLGYALVHPGVVHVPHSGW